MIRSSCSDRWRRSRHRWRGWWTKDRRPPLRIDPAALTAACDDPGIKDKLCLAVDAAISRGVFGSPFIIVDGEPFWGHDRLPQVDRWLATGGW
jgi:hypothetical protein